MATELTEYTDTDAVRGALALDANEKLVKELKDAKD